MEKETREIFIDYIKEACLPENFDGDYTKFMNQCMNKIRTEGFLSLNYDESRHLADLFFGEIYRNRPEYTLDKAIELYQDYVGNPDVHYFSADVAARFAYDMIEIYKKYR